MYVGIAWYTKPEWFHISVAKLLHPIAMQYRSFVCSPSLGNESFRIERKKNNRATVANKKYCANNADAIVYRIHKSVHSVHEPNAWASSNEKQWNINEIYIDISAKYMQFIVNCCCFCLPHPLFPRRFFTSLSNHRMVFGITNKKDSYIIWCASYMQCWRRAFVKWVRSVDDETPSCVYHDDVHHLFFVLFFISTGVRHFFRFCDSNTIFTAWNSYMSTNFGHEFWNVQFILQIFMSTSDSACFSKEMKIEIFYSDVICIHNFNVHVFLSKIQPKVHISIFNEITIFMYFFIVCYKILYRFTTHASCKHGFITYNLHCKINSKAR